MSDRVAFTVYGVALWLAFFGMVAFTYANPITRRAKIAGAIVFVVIVVETIRLPG